MLRVSRSVWVTLVCFVHVPVFMYAGVCLNKRLKVCFMQQPVDKLRVKRVCFDMSLVVSVCERVSE